MSEAANAFEHQFAELDDVRMHYVALGRGQPLVLLHGWPQSWYEWRDLMPLLANDFRLIAPDLRGLGDSSRPDTGYDTETLAGDVWTLMHDHLGYKTFAVVGHDWGGPIAYALAASHRDAVTHLGIIDVAIPGDGGANLAQGGRRWHHAFHQTAELPEALIAGREAIYLGWFYRNYGATPSAISDAAVTEYLRTYAEPDAFRCGLAYYRNIPRDIELNEAHVRRGKLVMPVLALGGRDGWGRGEEVMLSCQRIAENVSGGVIDNAGHWLPEEQPQVLAQRLRDFLFGSN